MTNVEALRHTDAFLRKKNQEEFIRAMHYWDLQALQGYKKLDIYHRVKNSYGTATADYVSDAIAYKESHLAKNENGTNI